VTRDATTSQPAEKLSFGHSECSLRSEESLFREGTSSQGAEQRRSLGFGA